MFQYPRETIVGLLFLLLVGALIGSILYGRRLIVTERTDAVFGNPVRALGGWHWIVAGVSTILVIWFYFSWDAARAWFPDAANELCQVAKVDSAINPVRSNFPFEERLLEGTELLARDNIALDEMDALLEGDGFTDAEREELGDILAQMRQELNDQANPSSLSAENRRAIDAVGKQVGSLAERLASGELPADAAARVQANRESQERWGAGTTEIPPEPITTRGARFDAIVDPLRDASSEFGRVRNRSDAFDERMDTLDERIEAAADAATTPPVRGLTRQLDKILKRIDDGQHLPA